MADTEKAPLSNEEALQLCGQNPDETKDFIMQQTMYRIKDPKVSLPFYSNVLGMQLLTKLDFPSMKFSLYFMGYEESTPDELGTRSRTEWALGRIATIELTQNVNNDSSLPVPLTYDHLYADPGNKLDLIKRIVIAESNWGTENDPNFKYHNGNQEPKGFGHIGLKVPDVYKACERFEKLGVTFIKKPDDGKMKGIAFITDPDGYWIEILNNKVTADIAHQQFA